MRLYGCHNRDPYKTSVPVQDGWTKDGRRIMKDAPNQMAPDCRYTLTELGRQDQGCTGCKWRVSNV